MSNSNDTKITGGVAVLAALAGSACTTPHTTLDNPVAASKIAVEYGGPKAADLPPAQVAGLVFEYPGNIDTQVASQAYNVGVEASRDAAAALVAGKAGFCKADLDKATLGVDRLKKNAITHAPTFYNNGVGPVIGSRPIAEEVMYAARNHDMSVMDDAYRAGLKRAQKDNCISPSTASPATTSVLRASPRLVSAPAGLPPIQISISNGANAQQAITVGSHTNNVMIRREEQAGTQQR